LEGEKRYPYGHYNATKRKTAIENAVDRIKRKIEVFEIEQNPQVAGDGENEQKFREDFVRMAFIN
jgi:hypothetical protein